MSLPIGLQLYSIKDETEKDFKGTLRKVAQMGYDGVEFAGYGGLGSKELKELLDELGLKACGSHIGIQALTDNIDEIIEYNLVIGNKYIICPWSEFSSKTNILDIAAKLKIVGEKCKAKGLICGYHNHDHEFKKFDGELGLDILLKSVDAGLLVAEIDTYWVEFAGIDPASYIKKHAGRCELIHIKDMQTIGNTKESTEVGNGTMNFVPIIKEAEKQGAAWLIVEQEYFTIPSLESVKICYDNLKKLVEQAS
jgi:sugar phosphate isomerase/epimerase